MNFELLIMFLGFVLLIIGFTKQIENKKEIEVKYLPRDIYDELVMNSVLK